MEKIFLDTKEIKDFTKQCLNNESIYDFQGSIDIIKEYWNQAKDVDELVSDETIFNEYSGTIFTNDDFFCTCGK